jgi:cation diffusion facilitator CzcD-associated flavoprotein CzcO
MAGMLVSKATTTMGDIAAMSIDSRHVAVQAPPFDPDVLRERYRHERDKRRRADGNAQYVDVTGAYGHYLDDPDGRPVGRAAIRGEVTVAIVGGGFAGLVAGARLKQAGIDDVRIIEKGSDVGGTWYWNRYPGAQCDVESYVYLPLLEETGYVPTEKYAHGPEILDHCRRIAWHFGLYDNACLSTVVTEVSWDAARRRWLIRTDRDDEIAARFMLMGNGPLHRPKLPAIPGMERFGGRSFHTSRWDYGYTGGDSNGGLDRLRDQRVGIIGTGATAVQVVPHLAGAARHLSVFQRTPSSVDVRDNRPTDPKWAADLRPGWQTERMDNFTTLTSGGLADHDLVMDGWTDMIARLVQRLNQRAAGRLSDEDLARNMEMADFEKMEQIRARIDRVVEDPATAAALKPWYRQLCKRPCFHDEYLQAFNRPDVTLVDTDGRGVDEITERGVVVAGTEHELDGLIFATGFEVGTDYTHRAGYDVVGVDGLRLSEHWAEGMRSLYGIHVHGFPNMFVVGHAQGAFTVNYPHLLDQASRHLAHVLRRLIDDDVTEVAVTAEAEAAWLRTLADNARNLRAFQEECTPGYYNNEGQPSRDGFVTSSYGKGPRAFFELLAEWRAAGNLAGLEVRH